MTYPHQTYIDQALSSLRSAIQNVRAEISDYPTPISGCDAQFNHLISERQKISEAISSLQGQPFVPTPRIPTQGARVESR